MGGLLLRARAELGDAIADALIADPVGVRLAAQARIAELSAAGQVSE
jgi:hypothetical protein